MATLDAYTRLLTARWDEQEKVARKAIEDDGGADEGFSGQYEAMIRPPSGIGVAQGGFGEAAARMIATFAVPSAILADLAAKRAILALHPAYRGPRLLPVDSRPGPDACARCHATSNIDSGSAIEAVGVCETVELLAEPFRDHPDHPANQEA